MNPVLCVCRLFFGLGSKVHYGCTKKDAAEIGFDDNLIYEFIKNPELYRDSLELIPKDREECLESF